MGNPNEPHDPDRQPTESFAHPAEPVTPPPTQQFASPGSPLPPPPGPPPTPGQPQTRVSGGWFSGSRRVGVLAGVAGLVIGGVIGGSIGWAATGNGDHQRNDTAYSRQLSSGDAQRNGNGQGDGAQTQRRARAATVGTITAENGASWTVATRNGRTVTVVIGADTRFGTTKAPQQQSDFVVGDRIAVVGKDKSGTIDATRVAKRAVKAGTAPSSATPPSASTQPG